MQMFKPKKKVQSVAVASKEPEEEPIEDEMEEESIEEEEPVEEEEFEEETKEVIKPTKKPLKVKEVQPKLQAGDIIPIQQTIGYQIIKGFDKEGQPLVISTDKLSEAEILSFIYKQ